MTRSLTSQRNATHLGSASSITLPVQPRPDRRPEYLGMGLFWSGVLVIVVATLLMYCWPAAERIRNYQSALDEAEAELEQVRATHAALELEREALDDPFTVEWILRREHNWQPTEK